MKIKDITFHYTDERMVKDLITITPLSGSILDAGSGKNKVWFNNLVGEKYECELEDGVDYLTQWNKKVNWVIGNPPFHLGWAFLEKSLDIADTGIAMLGNLNFLNSTVLPNRLEKIQQKGFYINKIHIVQDKRWFGRYFYVIFTKQKNDFISFNTNTYSKSATTSPSKKKLIS